MSLFYIIIVYNIIFILFAIIAFCLVLVTDSLLMSAGIFLLLLVVDYFIAEWEKRHKQNNLNKK